MSRPVVIGPPWWWPYAVGTACLSAVIASAALVAAAVSWLLS